MTGSAGQRRVPEHFLASLEIPLPTFLLNDFQKVIAEQLGNLKTCQNGNQFLIYLVKL
jgi:hypothetical protein